MQTTKAVLAELHKVLCEQYEKQLGALPIKPATRGALLDGFKDGAREGMRHVCEMLGVEVKA
jgi:hypothetical protein